MKRHNSLGLLLAGLVTIVSLIVLGLRSPVSAPNPLNPSQTVPVPDTTSTEPDTEAAFNSSKYSIDDPTSPWIIVNKARPLPDNYRPDDLRTPAVALRLSSTSEEMKLRDEAATALEAMFQSAQSAGFELMIASAFRSQSTQQGLYNRYVAQDGQAAADTYSARPGHSEHQTGWGVDVEPASRQCEVEVCFADLPEGQWVAANARHFGYIVRYEKGKDSLTGYTYEPWHLRYVGRELATELAKTGSTLEQFFGLSPALSY